MKNIILSADNERKIYKVPDIVADNLDEYAMEFCSNWLRNSPDAKKYRKKNGFVFNERDFIEYLNTYKFSMEISILVINIGWIDFEKELPEQYRDYPMFNF